MKLRAAIGLLAFLASYASSQSCGLPDIPPIEDAPKIVGGRIAKPKYIPFLALAGWILTAAHCVFENPSPGFYFVDAGRQYENNDSQGFQRVPVSQVIYHSSYNPDTFDNDIALLKLSLPLNYSSFVSPVCLPATDVIDNQLCFVTGFGETKGTGGEGVLKQAGILVIPSDTCTKPDWYGNGVNTTIMICAGYAEGGHDSCQGDSGGPFVCKTNGLWQQKGIVSWGLGCADPKKPGVYTRVIKYKSWIETTIGGGSIETTTRGVSIETTTRSVSIETTTRGVSIETTTRGVSIETTTRGVSIETTTRGSASRAHTDWIFLTFPYTIILIFYTIA